MKIAVIGASGYVGYVVFQNLVSRFGEESVQAFVHSDSKVWKLGRSGAVSLKKIDLLNVDELKSTLEGFDTVVNCSRGDRKAMQAGIVNLIGICRTSGARLIHISSSAVFGNDTSGARIDAQHPYSPEDDYGEVKGKQDAYVQKFIEQGGSAAVLIPPNITGPASPYLNGLLESLYRGTFSFVDEGALPFAVIDVRNLALAVCQAVEKEHFSGIYMVADPEPISWKDMVEIMGFSPDDFQSRQLAQVRPRVLPKQEKLFSMKILTVFLSPAVRRPVKKVRFWSVVEGFMRSAVEKLPASLFNRLKLIVSSKDYAGYAPDELRGLSKNFLLHQVRNCTYSNEIAEKDLAYRPLFSTRQSLMDFVENRKNFTQSGTEYETHYRHLRKVC